MNELLNDVKPLALNYYKYYYLTEAALLSDSPMP